MIDDALLSFKQRNPQIEVRYDLLSIALVKLLRKHIAPFVQAFIRRRKNADFSQ